MQRMQRKQRGYRCATPHRTGHRAQKKEQHDGIRRVEDHARQMMACRFQAVDLAIKSVRHQGHRLPIRQTGMRECPADRIPGKSAANVRIIGHIVDVVIVGEVQENGWQIYGPNAENQQHANQSHAVQLPFSEQVEAHIKGTAQTWTQSCGDESRPKPFVQLCSERMTVTSKAMPALRNSSKQYAPVHFRHHGIGRLFSRATHKDLSAQSPGWPRACR
jgi:hypothetical protein